MYRLDTAKRSQAIAALVEGDSIRGVSRMTGIALNTVMRLGVEAGQACAEYQDNALRNLNCCRLECDEIWAFCRAKAPTGGAGRYQIVMSTVVSPNTQTGKVWQWVRVSDVEGEPMIWDTKPRIDTEADFQKWMATQILKKGNYIVG